ncbi:ABC transporter permease subunit [Lachnospiraceae bacterium WCA-9-b2]|uniref:ABC transporter permease subunit n=1 Tax=Sporofaciens musculi TaxID=2681861 RepID=A0A7X3SKG9_9FIRM|nr:carbohydrate ABC transporter permease [Sporofaciens musculi]MXP77608.1 ABC transporter permease subunit [Sporofaciens musculi]
MKWRKSIPIYVILCALGLIMILPVFMMVLNSLMGPQEMKEAYGAVLGGNMEKLSARLLPVYPTLKPYVELLLDSPDFFVMFWNSVKQVFSILLGQTIVGTMAAWAFARYEFRGRKPLFLLYMILMVMPFQVTMVSSYLVLSKLALLDTHLAVIFPAIFSTFPVFIMEKFFRAIPREVFEAARMDGAGEFICFLRIGIPLGSPGIIAALILNFLEYWNGMEAPMTFLRTKSKFPLSLYLPEITTEQMSVAFAASVVMLLPAVLGFMWGRDYLQKGIEASGLKE